MENNVNRRALGDIGNLVGALSQRCIVSKDGLPPKAENPITTAKLPLNRPITRRYVEINSQQQVPPKPAMMEEETEYERVWGAKQKRRANRGTDPMMAIDVPSSNAVTAALDGKENSGAGRGLKKKQQALSATLTARSEAACAGFEVEMEEAYNDDPFDNIADIDKADIGNHLAVVEYIEDIYSFYRKTEMQACVAPDYMSRQADINEKMRAILIDWLIEVHLKFKLMPETLFLTINLIDRFLACESVARKELQLVGVTAMLIAAKYEEIWAPEVQDFVFITDNAYTRDQVLEMEKKMVNKLKFNLTVPTPYVFLVRFLKAAPSSDKQMEMLAMFLVELCLTEYAMVQYQPSLVAAAAVYTAHRTLHTFPSWTPTLQSHSNYSQSDLRDCGNMMASFHANAIGKAGGGGKLTAVIKKYSTSNFSSVAALNPLPMEGTPPLHH